MYTEENQHERVAPGSRCQLVAHYAGIGGMTGMDKHLNRVVIRRRGIRSRNLEA